MRKLKSCTARAPCSTANLGPGYDVFGLALDALYDMVTINRLGDQKKEITIHMSGAGGQSIPAVADSNSAGLVIKKMARDFGIKDSLLIKVAKGIPAGFGMGSSAASAAAAAVAFDWLFSLKNDKAKLVEYAAEGEVASAGAKHYDNVSASVLGGFVIVSSAGGELEFIRIDPPKDLYLVVGVPQVEVPEKKTLVARSVLPQQVPLRSVVHNVSGAAAVVAGFALKDVEMIASGMNDVIVEPARKHLIAGYDSVRKNALDAGALAVTISGAGPSMISFLKGRKSASQVRSAMSLGFGEQGIKSKTFVCRPSKGAMVSGTAA